MARKETINFIRETYFQPEQLSKWKEGANVENFDDAIKHIQSDKFLKRFAEKLEEKFSQEEIKTLYNMYTSEVSKKYSKNSFIFFELFLEIQKVLIPPLVNTENELKVVKEKVTSTKVKSKVG